MAEFDINADPLSLFANWLSEAEGAEPEDANAMALATADASGNAECPHGPSQRPR